VIAAARIEARRFTPVRRHASREEYFAWVGRVLPNPAGARMRRWFYNRFVSRWPDLNAWFPYGRHRRGTPEASWPLIQGAHLCTCWVPINLMQRQPVESRNITQCQ
jgi:hypothetical protein